MSVTWKPNPRLRLVDGIRGKEKQLQKIRNIKNLQTFLTPSKKDCHDGMKLKNMSAAVKRTITAIESNEMIVIAGDADCDGVTSLTIAYRYLNNYTDNIAMSYAQKAEGHGIEHQIEYLEDNFRNIDLLIIVDSSSSSVQGVEEVKEMFDCDVIILDHHEIENRTLPNAILVNPQQKEDSYPNKDLSGAGVVFKWIEQVEKHLPNGVVNVWQYLDLVAVGMIADVMKVTEPENRYLMMAGMKSFENTGLKRILKGASIEADRVTSTDVGFSIAPLINGAIRLGKIELPIQLLNTDDEVEARKLRLEMHKLNEARKAQQSEYADVVFSDLGLYPKDKVIIVAYDIPPEYNGLVAQTVAQRYQRPCILLNHPKAGTDIYGGSGRSFAEFDLKQLLNESGLVKQAVGHAGAMGVYIKEANIPLLVEYINENYNPEKTANMVNYYDLEIKPEEVSAWIPVVQRFNRLAGRGFDRIKVKITNIMVEEIVVMGKRSDTVKITTYDGVNLLKFKTSSSYAQELSDMQFIDVYGELQLNRWFRRGMGWVETPQLFIENYEVK